MPERCARTIWMVFWMSMSQSSPGQRRQRNFRVDSGQGPACPSHTDTNSPALLTLGGDALHEHINDDDGARAADASAAETRYHHQRPGPPQEMVSLGGHPSTRQGVCVCVYRSLGQQRRNVPGSVPMLLPQSQDIQARVCFEVRTPFPSLQASVPHFLILPSLLPNIGYPRLLEKRDPQPATALPVPQVPGLPPLIPAFEGYIWRNSSGDAVPL